MRANQQDPAPLFLSPGCCNTSFFWGDFTKEAHFITTVMGTRSGEAGVAEGKGIGKTGILLMKSWPARKRRSDLDKESLTILYQAGDP
jgi:hypothetical protein